MLVSKFPTGTKLETAQISNFVVAVAENSTDKITLNWTNPIDKKFSGVMIRYKVGSYPLNEADGTQAYNGTGSTFILDGLSAGTVYYFRAFAYARNSSGTKTVYNLSTAGAQNYIRTYSNPATNLVASSIVNNPTQLTLAWTNPVGIFSGIMIRYKTGSYPTSPTDGTQAYYGTASTVTVSSLSPGTDYYFRAFSSNGVAYNNAITGQQSTAKTYSSPITSLSATNVLNVPGTINLAWTAPVGTYTSIMIRRKEGGYPTSPTDGTQVYSGKPTTHSLSATDLTGGTTYYFRAFVYDGVKYNALTTGQQISAKTYSAPVTGLAVTPITNDTDSLTVTWVAPVGSYSVIVVRCKAGSYPTSPTDGTSVFSGVGTTATINGLAAGTTYYFRAFVSNGSVYNDNSAGQQGYNTTYSNTITGFAVAKVSSTSLSDSWVAPAGTYKQVMIRYKAGSYPSSISDGTQAYLGTGTSVTVGSLASGTTYYFRAFVSNSDSVYNTNTANQQANNMTKVAAGQAVFTSSQTWTVPAGVTNLEAFEVGGGAGGAPQYLDGGLGGAGGGAGYTKTYAIPVTPGQSLVIAVGAGGVGGNWDGNNTKTAGKAGGSSSVNRAGTLYTANGGQPSIYKNRGGNGGSGGGNSTDFAWGYDGGSDGSAGLGQATYGYSVGQGTTTKAFGEASGTLYSGGGGGGGATSTYGQGYSGGAGGAGGGGKGGSSPYDDGKDIFGSPGTSNTGGGGGGNGNVTWALTAGSGGSGIVIIRWPEQ